MLDSKSIYFLGYASSIGGPGPGCGDGPLFLQKSEYFAGLNQSGLDLHWQLMTAPAKEDKSKLESVTRQCTLIANHVADLVKQKKFFLVLGGDHSCAIGTWSGVCQAMQSQGPLGFIWVDAHLDSHTPQTTLTGNLHGMPLACLLGHGEKCLIDLAVSSRKFNPENICLIGIRSYEPEERELLERLKVRVIYMEEVQQRGLAAVMDEALQIATKGTVGYGLSIDIDSVDPADAPGTDVVAPGGLSGEELYRSVQIFAGDPRLLGAEIVEFDPHRDIDQKTEILITKLVRAITLGKIDN